MTGKGAQDLSEQQLVDCDKRSKGCNGGLANKAWDWMKSAGGVTSEASYPYKGRAGSCQAKTPVVNVGNYGRVGRDTKAVMQALEEKGPVCMHILEVG